MTRLVFLKLGGSLITDKHNPNTPKMDVIARAAQEIHTARQQDPDLMLVLGHGSGSFGHNAASKFGTRQGVQGAQQWMGFVEVWQHARALNTIVIETLNLTGLDAVSFPVSAGAITADGAVQTWDLAPLKAAMDHKLLPVVYGDVTFDAVRGGTILSTEDIFTHLSRQLKPQQILLAGLEAGVWQDYPTCAHLVETITPQSFASILPALGGSAAADVTGGMRSKVEEMLALVEDIPGLEIVIFSGTSQDAIYQALKGNAAGTRITK